MSIILVTNIQVKKPYIIHHSKITIDLKMAFTEAQITNLMDLLKIPEEKRNFEGFWDQIKIVYAVYLSKNDNTLEKILNNPGLQHLAENIFWNLNVEHLKICGLINQSCQKIFVWNNLVPGRTARSIFFLGTT